MNATLHDPKTDELLAEIECHPPRRAPADGRPWRWGFDVVEEPAPLRTGLVIVKLEDGRVGRAVVKALSFPSRQLRRSGVLFGSGPFDGGM